jgi:aspartate racemase
MIGLIAGLGPAATVYYYQGLVAESARRGVRLRLLINHADVARTLGLARKNERGELARYLADRAAELQNGGATILAVGAVTPHLCREELAPLLNLPLVDLVAVIQGRVRQAGFRRVALLGTRTVLESRLFGALKEAVSPTNPEHVQRAHELYLSVVERGIASPDTCAALRSLAAEMIVAYGAEAVILAGTELALVPAAAWGDILVVDCAGAHIRAIIDAAEAS